MKPITRVDVILHASAPRSEFLLEFVADDGVAFGDSDDALEARLKVRLLAKCQFVEGGFEHA